MKEREFVKIESVTENISLARKLLSIHQIPEDNEYAEFLNDNSEKFKIPTYTYNIFSIDNKDFEEVSLFESQQVIKAISAALVPENIVTNENLILGNSLTDIINVLFAKLEKNLMIGYNLLINPKTFYKYNFESSDILDYKFCVNLYKIWTANVIQTNLVPEEEVYLISSPKLLGIMPIRPSYYTKRPNEIGFCITHPLAISKVNLAEIFSNVLVPEFY